MFVLSNFIIAAAKLLDFILWAYYWLIIIRALISWVNADPFNPIVQFLHKVTEPVLEPVRRILPAGLRFGIDISPIIVLLVIHYLLRGFLIRSLFDLAMRVSG